MKLLLAPAVMGWKCHDLLVKIYVTRLRLKPIPAAGKRHLIFTNKVCWLWLQHGFCAHRFPCTWWKSIASRIYRKHQNSFGICLLKYSRDRTTKRVLRERCCWGSRTLLHCLVYEPFALLVWISGWEGQWLSFFGCRLCYLGVPQTAPIVIFMWTFSRFQGVVW